MPYPDDLHAQWPGGPYHHVPDGHVDRFHAQARRHETLLREMTARVDRLTATDDGRVDAALVVAMCRAQAALAIADAALSEVEAMVP